MKNPVQISDIRRLLPTLSLGLIIGAIDLPTIISFAILIYSGDLASFAGMGIGMILFGGLIVQLVIAFTSSIPGMMGGPQDSPAAILGVMAVAILAQMPDASPETKFVTVTVAVMLTSILSGIFFLLIGGSKLGRFVRFIPYPVVAGFIAGTGFLLIQGAFGVMTGLPLLVLNLSTLFTPENLLRWIPSLVEYLLPYPPARKKCQHFHLNRHRAMHDDNTIRLFISGQTQ